MCSWCWAFRPVWTAVQAQLPDTLHVQYLLGGLAPDSDMPMSADTQHMIRMHWQSIEQQVPGTEFNYRFWTDCQPRRSTYPACRAVIAARLQHPEMADAMIKSIQQAYYLQARNPSDDDVLVDLAVSLSLDRQHFAYDLNAPDTQTQLMDEIHMAQRIGVQGFPCLILEKAGRYHRLAIDYNHADAIMRGVGKIIAL